MAFQFGGVISFSLDTSFCILEWAVGGGVVGAAFACRWLKPQSTIILGNHEDVAALLFEACSLRCLEDVNEDAIALDSSMYFSVSARAPARSLVRRTTPHVAFETCLVVAVNVTFRRLSLNRSSAFPHVTSIRLLSSGAATHTSRNHNP